MIDIEKKIHCSHKNSNGIYRHTRQTKSPISRSSHPQLFLVHNLEGHLLARQQVCRQLNLGKAPRADGLVEVILAVQHSVGGRDLLRHPGGTA